MLRSAPRGDVVSVASAPEARDADGRAKPGHDGGGRQLAINPLRPTGPSGSPPHLADAGVLAFGVKGVSIPAAVSVFPDELYQAPRSWAEQAYPKLIHFNRLPKGGHFAAWEQPKLFSEEVRAGFRSLRPML